MRALGCGGEAGGRLGRVRALGGAGAGEEVADDLLNGDLADVEVTNGQVIEQGLAGGDDAVARNTEADKGRLEFDNLAPGLEKVQVGRRRGGVALDGQDLEVRVTFEHVGERSVKDDATVIDDDDAGAEFLDISHVVAGE